MLAALARTTSGDENDLEAGWAALAQVAPGAATAIGDYALRQMFEREEVSFAPMYGGEAYVMYTSGLESIRAAKPKEGMIAVPNMLVIPRNASNPELARRFVHYALSPESQLAFTNAYGAAPRQGSRCARGDHSLDALRRRGVRGADPPRLGEHERAA